MTVQRISENTWRIRQKQPDEQPRSDPGVTWWIPDVANWISISFAVIAYLCHQFVTHQDTSPFTRFVDAAGHSLDYIAVGWIILGGFFATTCWIRHGADSQTVTYLALLVLAAIAVVVAAI